MVLLLEEWGWIADQWLSRALWGSHRPCCRTGHQESSRTSSQSLSSRYSPTILAWFTSHYLMTMKNRSPCFQHPVVNVSLTLWCLCTIKSDSYKNSFIVVRLWLYSKKKLLSTMHYCLTSTGKASEKNGHILPTGQWYAPSADINDALIMPEYARAFQSMPEYARVCQSMPECARVCQSLAKFCQSSAQVIPKSSPSCPQVVPKMSPSHH